MSFFVCDCCVYRRTNSRCSFLKRTFSFCKDTCSVNRSSITCICTVFRSYCSRNLAARFALSYPIGRVARSTSPTSSVSSSVSALRSKFVFASDLSREPEVLDFFDCDSFVLMFPQMAEHRPILGRFEERPKLYRAQIIEQMSLYIYLLR